MTTKLTVLVAGLGTLLIVGGTGPAHAWSKTFSGTRDQVRTACADVGGDLIESPTHTICANNNNGTMVECGNDGKCWGAGSGPQPRSATYGILMHFGIEVSPKPFLPPQSLVDSNTESPSAAPAAPAGGSGGGSPDIIY